MRYKKQSRLERIVSKARLAAAAGVLSLVPSNIHSESVYIPHQTQEVKEVQELGKAHQILLSFEEYYMIPGAADVLKIENPEANYLAIFVAKKHENEVMDRNYRRKLEIIHSNTYRIHSYIIKKFKLPGIYKEAVTPSTLFDFEGEIESAQVMYELGSIIEDMARDGIRLSRRSRNYIHRQNINFQEELKYDAVKKLAFEGVKVFPSETKEANENTGKIILEWRRGNVSFKEVIASNKKRERLSLYFASLDPETVKLFDWGAWHVDGGRNIENSTFYQTMQEWNPMPENKYKQFCAVIIIPKGFDAGDMPIIDLAQIK